MTGAHQPAWEAPRTAAATTLALVGAYVTVVLALPVWVALAQLQKDPTYRIVSGSCLALLLGMQWRLFLVREHGSGDLSDRAAQGERGYRRHLSIGLLSAPLLYLHTSSFGHGYLQIFSIAYLCHTALGCLAPRLLGPKKRWFQASWVVVHVAGAVIMLAFVVWHVGVVVVYE